jgi:hypothetical protein
MKKHGGKSIAIGTTREVARLTPAAGRDRSAGRCNLYVHRCPADASRARVNVTGAAASDARNLIGRGFCNFFGQPNDDQVFRYQGKSVYPTPIDPAPAIQTPLRITLMKLAYALEGPKASDGAPAYNEDDKAGRKNVDPGDNPNIPSGYTYLLQLVAHDMVHSASSLARTDDSRVALNNDRSAKLRLEAIYDGGPEASPLFYEAAGADPNMPKSYLRLGPLNTGNAFTCPFRDLARLDLSRAAADTKQRVEDPPPPAGPAAPEPAPAGDAPRTTVLVPLPDVMVGDNRNDDYAILSQLTVVFHLLHNGLVKWAEDVPVEHYASNPWEAAMDRYYFARTAAVLIFRNILRRDVMKRLLHPAVYELYDGKPPPDVFKYDGRIPLEFSHGAFRVCHAMPRGRYVFNERRDFFLNDVLLENSTNRPNNMPLPEFWAVAWSYFFDLDPGNRENVNLSSRLRPRYDPQTQVAPLFDKFDETSKPGLAYRDMLSAALAGLWSVPAMMAKLADAKEPKLANLFKEAKLANNATRETVVRKWLDQTFLDGHEMTDDEKDALAKDPPLPFFLMFEAMYDPDSRGLRLGLLGSVIVAAVIYGILDADPITDKNSLDEQLSYLRDSIFGSEGATLPFPRLDSMSDLITFVSKLHGLAGAKPRFI